MTGGTIDQRLTDALYHQFADVIGRRNGSTSVTSLHGVECAIGTSIGRKRLDNQDRAMVLAGSFLNQPAHRFLLFALSDGIGGMRDGAICARDTLAMLAASLIGSRNSTLQARLDAAVQAANDFVYSQYRGSGGATLSALIVSSDGEARLANVGDSRVYEIRPGPDSTLLQLTEDDTLGAQVAKLADHQEAAHETEDSTRSELIQYIGIGQDLVTHNVPLSPSFSSSGYVLTTDGIHSIPRRTLSGIVLNAVSAIELAHRLVDISIWCGGYDNGSVICVLSDTLKKFLAARQRRVSFAALWTPLAQYEIIGAVATPTNVDESREERKQREDATPPTARKIQGRRYVPSKKGVPGKPSGRTKRKTRPKQAELKGGEQIDILFLGGEDDEAKKDT